MTAAGHDIRFTRLLLFQICFAFVFIAQYRPASGCSSFLNCGRSSLILLSAATNVRFAAAAVVGDAAEGEVRGVESPQIGKSEHRGDETSLKLPDTYSAVGLRNIPGAPVEGVAAGVNTGGVDKTSRPFERISAGGAGPYAAEHEEEEYGQAQPQRRRRLRQAHHPFRKLDAKNDKDHNENGDTQNLDGGSNVAAGSEDWSEAGDQEGGGMVKFRLGGKVESFMAGSVMQNYLNQLVEETVADTKNQTCNIAFVKTHKTASTTAATIFYRYGKRHNLNVANFVGHQSSIALPEAVKQIEQSGKPVDLMHYHHAWDGFYEGRWADAKAAYKKIMRDPSVMKLVTVMREPVSHYMSYYYYFLQPETGLSITEYLALSKRPDDPQFQGVFRQQRRAGKDIGWHGFKLLHNPLCAEFGIRTAQELEDFIRDDLPEFAMIMLTEQFEESLAVFMRMFNWRPIDMTYCRVIETKEGVARYDGKLLANVPKIHDLPPEALTEIKRQTQLDQALYKAAVKIYLEIRKNYEDRLEEDVRNIRTIQSAVHGYLDFDSTSPAHEWYEGDVHCFADPSPVRPF